ncbi:MAG: hypothetical protein V1872_10305 [bacterium]
MRYKYLAIFFITIVFSLGITTTGQAVSARAGDGEIYLSWGRPSENADGTPCEEENFRGFKIYRSEVKGAECSAWKDSDWKLINQGKKLINQNNRFITKLFYRDRDELLTNNHTYYYRIVGVNGYLVGDGKEKYEKYYEADLCIQKEVSATSHFIGPTELKALGGYRKIVLSWKRHEGRTKVKQYNVYKTKIQGNYTFDIKDRLATVEPIYENYEGYEKYEIKKLEINSGTKSKATYDRRTKRISFTDYEDYSNIGCYYIIENVAEDGKIARSIEVYANPLSALPSGISPKDGSVPPKLYDLKYANPTPKCRFNSKDQVVEINWQRIEGCGGYNIYRRKGGLGDSRFEKLTSQIISSEDQIELKDLIGDDNLNKTLFYKIAVLNSSGEEVAYSGEAQVFTGNTISKIDIYPDLKGRARRQGERIIISLSGEAGAQASFQIIKKDQHENPIFATDRIPIEEEEEKPGIYSGTYSISQEDLKIEVDDVVDVEVIGYLGVNSKIASQKLTFDFKKPSAVQNFKVTSSENEPSVNLSWKPPNDKDIIGYRIYRGYNPESAKVSERGIKESLKKELITRLGPKKSSCTIDKDQREYLDNTVVAGTTYFYLITAVDKAENESGEFKIIGEIAVAGCIGSAYIQEVKEDTSGAIKKTGDKITITMIGEHGEGEDSLKATFKIAGIKTANNSEKEIEMKEQNYFKEGGRYLGEYVGEYIIQEKDKVKDAKITAFLKGKIICQNSKEASSLVKINVPHEEVDPRIIYIKHNINYDKVAGFSGKLVEGDTFKVEMLATSGCTAMFSLGSDIVKIKMKEEENSCKYTLKLKEKEIEKDIPLSLYKTEYTVKRGDYCLGGEDEEGESLVGCLISKDGWEICMKHGEYKGVEDVKSETGNNPDDPGCLSKIGAFETELTPIIIDTSVTILVGADDPVLKVNEVILDRNNNVIDVGKDSKTEITVTVKDVNDKEREGHNIAFTLTTTDEYTGVVGGGELDKEIGKMTIDFDDDVTDSFGETKATYTAGFAAKTALIIAKDLETGDCGVGYIATYKEKDIGIKLRGYSVASVGDYTIEVLSVDPPWLTADGRSRARIIAVLKDDKGNIVEGGILSFTLSPIDGFMNGSVDPAEVRTDSSGKVYGYYTAGKKIGTVTITITHESGANVTVEINLESDAPAKIIPMADPSEIDADGRSRSQIKVKVTDINDNPNKGTTVDFNIIGCKKLGCLRDGCSEGDMECYLADTKCELTTTSCGKLEGARERTTDINGEADINYIAGTTPDAIAYIRAKVSSRPPTPDEELKARGTIFIPRVYDAIEIGDEFTIVEWLKEEREDVEKGEHLVIVKAENDTEYTIKSPVKGRLFRKIKIEHETVNFGETIGLIMIEE